MMFITVTTGAGARVAVKIDHIVKIYDGWGNAPTRIYTYGDNVELRINETLDQVMELIRAAGKVERLGALAHQVGPFPESAGDRAKRRFDEMAGNADLKQRLEALRTRLINVREHTAGMVQDAVGRMINDDVKGLQELAAEKPPDISADVAGSLIGMLARLKQRVIDVRDGSSPFKEDVDWPIQWLSDILENNVDPLQAFIEAQAETKASG